MMQYEHLSLDTQSRYLHCGHCGVRIPVSPQCDLMQLDQITGTFVQEHGACIKIGPPAPVRHNGCWNKPRPTKHSSYMAQDGWIYSEDGLERTPRLIQIFHVMSTDCRYDQPGKDPACAGCVHMDAPLVLESAATC